MTAVKAPNVEPIPGYRLIEPLGGGGFGEVWKCEAPGGLHKAVKFVRGDGSDDLHNGPVGAEQELRALQHIKTIRHPFLLAMDRVERIDGELVIVMELADRSLHDLLGEYRAAGLPGVPRSELLRYLAETAEVLDLMNQEHGLQHLDVKPRNLFLVGRHVKVGDFGLVNSMAEMSGSTASAVQLGVGTPLYAAPECFLGRITPYTDQYSLAIAYYELLVGEPPFTGKNFRQVALQHMQAQPDLSALPAADRPAVARALSKDPGGRFPSCTAFVEALQTGEVGASAGPPSSPSRPKAATRTDIPVVNLAATPVVAHQLPLDKGAPPEVGRETREFSPPGRTPMESPRPSAVQRAADPPGDPLAGCQFLECVVRNPAGETWTARTADGRDRLVRFVFGTGGADPREAERLARLRALHHEALEPMEIVGGGDQRLTVVSDACPTTLAARLTECQGTGQVGMPRAELLARIGEAAVALDALFRVHGVRHLGLTPRHFLLRNGRVRLLHFGLVELVHIPAGHPPAALNPRYAAPELFDGKPHASSDQYSLALIFYEFLTGAHPFRAISHRQMTAGRQRIQPDLSLAPAPDRAALERALHADPSIRFPSCGDFLAALDGGAGRGPGSRVSTATAPGMAVDLALTPTTRSRMRQAINGLVAEAAGDLEVREYNNIRYLLHPGRILHHQFSARLTPGVAPLRLEGFREQWRAARLKSDGDRIEYLAPLSAGAWRRLLGMRPGLKVQIDMPPPRETTALADVSVRIETVRCGAEAGRLLEEIGPQILENLRACLQAMPERRNQARLRFERAVQVAPVLDAQEVGETIASQTRDISLRGMGLVMPCRPPSMLLHIRLPADAAAGEMDVPACIVRATPRSDGCYEVGVRFMVEEGG